MDGYLIRRGDMIERARQQTALRECAAIAAAATRVMEDWTRCPWTEGGLTLGFNFYYRRELERSHEQ